jgi:excisionase family DNA binding protein
MRSSFGRWNRKMRRFMLSQSELSGNAGVRRGHKGLDAQNCREAAGLTGLCVSTLYNLMGHGRLQTIKIGGRRLVTREALDALIGASDECVATTGSKVAISKKSVGRDTEANG